MWLPLVMMALVGLLAFNFAVVLPVLAKRTFHGSGGTYGLLSTMLSLGSIVGSLGVGLIHHPRRPYLVATSLIGVVAQRLLRVLCPQCKRLGEPSERDRLIMKAFGKSVDQVWEPVGCEACNRIGYSG